MGADPLIPLGGAMKTNMELTKELFVQKGFITQWILGIGSINP
jgi:hypothetical protein